MSKKILKFFLSPWLGKKQFQFLFRNLYLLSLKGMNAGGAGNFRTSGEKFAAEYVCRSLLKFVLGRPAVFFDVGANAGNYSLLLNEIFEQSRRPFVIYSFEPSASGFAKLKSQAQAFKNIKTFNLGLSDTDKTAVLFEDAGGSELASLYDRDLAESKIFLNKRETVQLATLDSFCSQNPIGFIDFLKIDVEGHELAILRGAAQMLKAKKIRFLQFEFGGTAIDSRIYFKDFFRLLGNDYNIYRILKNGLYPIKVYSETEEIFLTTNYFAEIKK